MAMERPTPSPSSPPLIGFKTAPIRVGWGDLVAFWRRAGELDCFDSAWVYDHCYPNDGDGSCFEGFVALTALAPLVPMARVGVLVAANPYRHPALLAKMAATLDHVTGGRLTLALGAGWHVPETAALGLDLPPLRERLDGLRSAVLLLRALQEPEAGEWPTDGSSSRTTGGVNLDAPPYRLRHARNDPRPVQGAAMPIWLGVQGERVGLRIAAELADGWNFSGVGTLDDFSRKRQALVRHAEELGRDPSTIEVSAQVRVDPADPQEALAACAAFVEAGASHVILYVDPRTGPAGIERLAHAVVGPLRNGHAR
jgi:alkanesulfonate monooxygenase SsuD/methylene tetrahydromethanopterin reductase-like flavin-dependent oxidoreductase (luciferase family)